MNNYPFYVYSLYTDVANHYPSESDKFLGLKRKKTLKCLLKLVDLTQI
jgi:hypothetical protein